MECRPDKYTVAELVEAWNNASLRRNEEYQRGAKWSKPQKQGLVDSIFRKYPIPQLFLHEIKSTGLGGHESIRYDVVDGQQRIRALAEYLHGDFPLLDSNDPKLKLPNSLRSLPAPWGKKHFSDLPTECRSFLENEEIDVFVITSVERTDEIRDLFIRLQSGTALSRQQVRDAWPGTIEPYIQKLAGKLSMQPSVKLFQLVDKRGVGPEDERDKYEQDRQFCAQLLCLFLARENDPRAIQGVGANDLDKLYHENPDFNVDGPGAERFEAVLGHTTKVLEFVVHILHVLALKRQNDGSAPVKKRKKFKKLEVISTFLFAQDLSRNKHRKLNKTFYAGVGNLLLKERDTNRTGKSESGAAIVNFYEGWRASVVGEIGIQLDPNRLFDENQKSEIFERDGGICQKCKLPVEEGEDEYGHFPEPHALSGKTVVENGRLVHKRCHPRGRPVADDDEFDGE